MLLVLLLAADRVAAALAGRALAGELAQLGSLGARPDVTVEGVPFLTQALRGRYRSVSVQARDVEAGDVRLPRLTVRLEGAHVPLGEAVAGAVTAVPVERVEAAALVPYDELAGRLDDRGLAVAPEGDRVRISGRVRLLGRPVQASALSALSVEDGRIVVRAEELDVGSDVLSGVATRALRGRFDQRLDLGGLPYGLVLDGVRVRPDGVAVTASARDAVLRR